MDAWIDLTDRETDEAWNRVALRLRFRPSVNSEEWPSIFEPRPYRTFSVAHFWDSSDRTGLEADLESNAARMLKSCTAPAGRLYALDWQHRCCWLRPHLLVPGVPWTIPAYPDGDYYVFLSEDLDFGWFAHPWEQSICVFGNSLLGALDENVPELFTNVLRSAV
jgi:hypothetical protein